MMKSAKKRCRKLWIGGVYFIPTMNNLGKTCELWNLVIEAKEGNKINHLMIKTKSLFIGLRNPPSLTTKEVVFKFKEAIKN